MMLQVKETTANVISRKLSYPTTYKATIPVKGLAQPQKVYTVTEPDKATPQVTQQNTHHSLNLPRASLTPGSPAMNSFDSVVLKILKSPSTKQKVREATNVAAAV